jgi:excisionase family DNA binding protein
MLFRDYRAGEARPVHPVSGQPADYAAVNVATGEVLPRWRKDKKLRHLIDQLVKAPQFTWMGANEAAVLLGCSSQTIRNWIRSGRLKASRPNHRYMVRGSDFVAFAESTRGVTPRIDVEAAL